MQNIIDFQAAKEKQQAIQEKTTQKAFLIAKMHVFMNEAEAKRKTLYLEYSKAFNSNDTKLMQKLALEIVETAGKLFAYTKCANLLAIQ